MGFEMRTRRKQMKRWDFMDFVWTMFNKLADMRRRFGYLLLLLFRCQPCFSFDDRKKDREKERGKKKKKKKENAFRFVIIVR